MTLQPRGGPFTVRRNTDALARGWSVSVTICPLIAPVFAASFWLSSGEDCALTIPVKATITVDERSRWWQRICIVNLEFRFMLFLRLRIGTRIGLQIERHRDLIDNFVDHGNLLTRDGWPEAGTRYIGRYIQLVISGG